MENVINLFNFKLENVENGLKQMVLKLLNVTNVINTIYLGFYLKMFQFVLQELRLILKQTFNQQFKIV